VWIISHRTGSRPREPSTVIQHSSHSSILGLAAHAPYVLLYCIVCTIQPRQSWSGFYFYFFLLSTLDLPPGTRAIPLGTPTVLYGCYDDIAWRLCLSKAS